MKTPFQIIKFILIFIISFGLVFWFIYALGGWTGVIFSIAYLLILLTGDLIKGI
jgi:thiamine transporter ThiT